MSHVALRRVMVRLLHDPVLVARLYAGSDAALEGVELTSTERDWLLGTPRAAWSADRERPARVLAGLSEEFPTSTALAPTWTSSFFASAPFHAAVQDRGSLAAALGEHLAASPDPAVAALARLEASMAAVRRAPSRPDRSPPGHLRRAAHAIVLVLPAGTSRMREQVLVTGQAGAHAVTAPVPHDGEDETLLVLRDAAGAVTVEELPPGLAAILGACDVARERNELLAVARSHGADPGEDAEILHALERDGLLL